MLEASVVYHEEELECTRNTDSGVSTRYEPHNNLDSSSLDINVKYLAGG